MAGRLRGRRNAVFLSITRPTAVPADLAIRRYFEYNKDGGGAISGGTIVYDNDNNDDFKIVRLCCPAACCLAPPPASAPASGGGWGRSEFGSMNE